jgi:hypothetical protein
MIASNTQEIVLFQDLVGHYVVLIPGEQRLLLQVEALVARDCPSARWVWPQYGCPAANRMLMFLSSFFFAD